MSFSDLTSVEMILLCGMVGVVTLFAIKMLRAVGESSKPRPEDGSDEALFQKADTARSALALFIRSTVSRTDRLEEAIRGLEMHWLSCHGNALRIEHRERIDAAPPEERKQLLRDLCLEAMPEEDRARVRGLRQRIEANEAEVKRRCDEVRELLRQADLKRLRIAADRALSEAVITP